MKKKQQTNVLLMFSTCFIDFAVSQFATYSWNGDAITDFVPALWRIRFGNGLFSFELVRNRNHLLFFSIEHLCLFQLLFLESTYSNIQIDFYIQRVHR